MVLMAGHRMIISLMMHLVPGPRVVRRGVIMPLVIHLVSGHLLVRHTVIVPLVLHAVISPVT